jgi:hypothetical protein
LPLVLLLLAAAAGALFVLGAGLELCDCAEVMLLAAEEAVPLVVGGAAVPEGGERLALEALEGVEGLLLDLRVEPTNFLKRFCMEDMKASSAAEGSWQEK